MREKVLNLLGLAQKAGKIVSSEDSVLISLKKNQAKIVFLGSDASISTLQRFEKKCYFYKTELNNSFTSLELSKSIGKSRMVLAVIDSGFASALKKYLGGNNIEG